MKEDLIGWSSEGEERRVAEVNVSEAN